jgi:hypothetical protein
MTGESTRVLVEIDGQLVWERCYEDGNPSGTTTGDPGRLEAITALLREALEQAENQVLLNVA